MNKKRQYLSLLLITWGFSLPSIATAQFISSGKAYFERKVSLKMKMQNQLEEDTGNEWMRSMIDKIATYTIAEFELAFDAQQSYYNYIKDQEVKGSTFSWGIEPGSRNKVYQNTKQNTYKAEKSFYENNYLIEDILPKYTWKIEEEVRTIAGYSCRKATTIIFDSVVVVAFYTDQILNTGGPESFNGLPGMILGIAIPRMYTTWFATKIEIVPETITPFKPEKGSKKNNQKSLIESINKIGKDWDTKNKNKLIWTLCI
jgi:GLPGLI family protein